MPGWTHKCAKGLDQWIRTFWTVRIFLLHYFPLIPYIVLIKKHLWLAKYFSKLQSTIYLCVGNHLYIYSYRGFQCFCKQEVKNGRANWPIRSTIAPSTLGVTFDLIGWFTCPFWFPVCRDIEILCTIISQLPLPWQQWCVIVVLFDVITMNF